MLQQQENFQLIRNDNLYKITIPTYRHIKDSVYYELRLADLSQNQTYTSLLRFNDFKQYHEQYVRLKLELPEFPKKHFWVRTNKNPELIEERRKMLEKYFQVVLNDPFSRGVAEVKKFVAMCKKGIKQKRSLSSSKITGTTSHSKQISVPKRHSEEIQLIDF